MIILKLGGSLLSSPLLREYLQLASEQGQGKLVIVPGGGVFAEQVRVTQKQWLYDDRAAHVMAILAMQQMAVLFQSLCADLQLVSSLSDIPAKLQQGKVLIWSPLLAELDADNVPASWDISSDSLAAWLASQLSASRLIVVKSAEIPATATVAQLSNLGILDKAFMNRVYNQSFTTECLSIKQIAQLAARLKYHV
ncbi:MAG: uridylate kinase [Methyloprofundus sp.]|nr:uridylate kinase [Methyloprofundus sp.]